MAACGQADGAPHRIMATGCVKALDGFLEGKTVGQMTYRN